MRAMHIHALAQLEVHLQSFLRGIESMLSPQTVHSLPPPKAELTKKNSYCIEILYVHCSTKIHHVRVSAWRMGNSCLSKEKEAKSEIVRNDL